MTRPPRDVRVLMVDDVDEEIEEEPDGDRQTRDGQTLIASPECARRTDRAGDEHGTEAQEESGHRVRECQRIFLNVDDWPTGSIHVLQPARHEKRQANRNTAPYACNHEVSPSSAEHECRCLID